MDRRGEISAGLDEAGVARIGTFSVRTKVDPLRLVGETAGKHRWQRCVLACGEVADGVVPGEFTVGERDQERIGTLVVEPVGNFLVYPRRRRRLRRREQDQEARVAQRLLDRRPQARRRRQRGVVAEHPQRPAPVPRLAEPLDHRLQRSRNRLVLGMAVRDEGVVSRHRNPSTRAARRRLYQATDGGDCAEERSYPPSISAFTPRSASGVSTSVSAPLPVTGTSTTASL